MPGLNETRQQATADKSETEVSIRISVTVGAGLIDSGVDGGSGESNSSSSADLGSAIENTHRNLAWWLWVTLHEPRCTSRQSRNVQMGSVVLEAGPRVSLPTRRDRRFVRLGRCQ